MTTPASAALSPHRTPLDLGRYAGHTVLGEPLALLFSAVMRLELGDSRGGTTTMSATMTTEEGNAFERALSRADASGPFNGHAREHDSERFVRVVHLVLAAVRDVEGVQLPEPSAEHRLF